MSGRFPSAHELANSNAALAVIVKTRTGPRILTAGPALLGSLAVTLTVLVGGLLGTGSYIFFRDDVVRSMRASQTQMQYAYEDRIAALRGQIDRVAARQLIDQDSVESRLQDLLGRQAQLETRQVVVGRLMDDAGRAGIRPPAARMPETAPPRAADGRSAESATMPAANAYAPAAKPRPAPEAMMLRLVEPVSGPRPLPDSTATDAPNRTSSLPSRGLPLLLEQARRSADDLEKRQIAFVASLSQSAEAIARRQRTAFDQTGLAPQRFARLAPVKSSDGIGGPLLPLPPGAVAGPFERALTSAQETLLEAARLKRIMNVLPISRPLSRDHETSSGFGPRLDPFTRGIAMHSGVDFRAASGTQARATAEGKVIEAGWVGGYGRMVEIDHGFGLTTRFGHLSAISVEVGESVKKGDVIGLVGSTGRSTGAHLHYEVRIDDEAVDPTRFLRAGDGGAAN